MVSKQKSILFSALRKVYKLLRGTGVGNIPGVWVAHGLLFRLLWSKESVMEVEGSKMYVNPNQLPRSYIRTFQFYVMSRGWEGLTTEMFKKVVKEGDTVVDLGANLGYYTLLAARLVGKKGKVYAFEPEPTNYALLLKNIELNGYNNIVPMQEVVSNISGTVNFFLDEKDTGAHTMYRPEPKAKSIEVPSVTLDEFFRDQEPRINVIKMDIEGAEIAAVQGMERIIGENENLKMFVEFYPAAIRRAGHSPQEFARKLLEDYHFSILALDDYGKNREYWKINNAEELMDLCTHRKVVNLFLEHR